MSTTYPTSNAQRGKLACVGLGMTLGSHLTPLARSYIEQADAVFAAVSSRLVEQWLDRLHADVRSLQPYYGNGDKPRITTYQEWVAVMLAEVRQGRSVCAVFYGHPGVFAWSPHEAIRQARREGYAAHMEPGISAADCLYADLGIDPGDHGCQHIEASLLLYRRRRIDTCGYLVLWQVGLVGDLSLKRFATGPDYRRVLVDRLAEDYPRDHPIIVYRGATLPTHEPLIRHARLLDLPDMEVRADDTVVLPPAQSAEPDTAMLERLAALATGSTEPTA